MRRRPVLMIAWIAICGGSVGLLLHPAVPEMLRSILQNPNRLVGEIVEYGAHVGVFFITTQLALICLDAQTKTRRAAILSCAMIMGVAADLAQTWIPTRGVDVFDAVCNVAGAVLATVVYQRMFRAVAKGAATMPLSGRAA